jgi:hypothetical protein
VREDGEKGPIGPVPHQELTGVAGLDRGARGRPKLVDLTATELEKTVSMAMILSSSGRLLRLGNSGRPSRTAGHLGAAREGVEHRRWTAAIARVSRKNRERRESGGEKKKCEEG